MSNGPELANLLETLLVDHLTLGHITLRLDESTAHSRGDVNQAIET
jgi:hypothetical protein